MRNIILATTLILTTATAVADDLSICKSIGEAAATAMRSHQQGMPMVHMMEGAANIEDKATAKFLQTLVISAYDKPRYMTESNQEAEIAEFRDTWYMVCIKSRMGE